MKKLLLLAAILFMPLAVNATYSHHSYYGNHKSGYSKHHGQKSHSYKKYSGYQKHSSDKKHKKHYGNPLVGHKMPRGCKWVWVAGKKETKCGTKRHKMKLAKFCAKYPNSRKCKGTKPPVTSVAEPAPLALLGLGLLVAFFARRK